jgi:hypothetical protein
MSQSPEFVAFQTGVFYRIEGKKDADHRMVFIIRLGVGLQHLFHAGHEFAVGLRRNDPMVDLPLVHPIWSGHNL